jgi:hypothetical protein
MKCRKASPGEDLITMAYDSMKLRDKIEFKSHYFNLRTLIVNAAAGLEIRS